MTRPDPHEAYAELSAGHALGALEPEDEHVFLRHLAGCARCERDLDSHLATLAHLAYAPDAAEPPPSLLAGIRAGVLASGREASFPDTPATVPTSLDEVRARRRRSLPSRSLMAVAAAAAMVIGLGAWNVTLQSDREQQDRWGDRVAAAMRELGTDGTDAVPLSSDGQVVALALVRGDDMTLLVDGLKANDSSATTYVLWGQGSFGDVRPISAFDVTEEGLDVREGLRMQAGVADVTRFMVTHEQGRTAPPNPSRPLVASGEV